MKIAIVGGSGFVGKHLTARLRKKHTVNILSRFYPVEGLLNGLGDHVTVHLCNDYSVETLSRLLEQHDVVINLVGILNERGHNGQGFYAAHVELSKQLITACQAAQVPRYLHMSALHADAEQGSSFYQRSKGAAENYAHSQHSDNLAVTSFRPSVIFGPGDSLCNRFADLIKFTPYFFPLACAQARFGPIYVGDVVEYFINAIDNEQTYNQRIDLCGPEIMTLADIVNLTAKHLQRPLKIIHLPDAIARQQAKLMEYLPNKPFSVDNYHSLKIDSICTGNCLGTTTLDETLPKYLKLNKLQQNALIMDVK